MKLQLHKGGLELLRIIQVADVLKEPVPQSDGGIDNGSMARRKRSAEEPIEALQLLLGLLHVGNQMGEFVPQRFCLTGQLHVL